jgi:hypothetical protein
VDDLPAWAAWVLGVGSLLSPVVAAVAIWYSYRAAKRAAAAALVVGEMQSEVTRRTLDDGRIRWAVQLSKSRDPRDKVLAAEIMETMLQSDEMHPDDRAVLLLLVPSIIVQNAQAYDEPLEGVDGGEIDDV